MDVVLPEDINCHLLKHFYSLDNDYLHTIENKEHALQQVSVASSKYFKSFAANPQVLIEKIDGKFKDNGMDDGKHEISLQFGEIVGFDLLINKNSKNNLYKITRTLNVIFRKENKKIYIITIFPGKYAPPLPVSAKTEQELKNAVEFWKTHKISKFNNFKETEKTIIRLNDKADKIWDMRFSGYGKSQEMIN